MIDLLDNSMAMSDILNPMSHLNLLSSQEYTQYLITQVQSLMAQLKSIDKQGLIIHQLAIVLFAIKSLYSLTIKAINAPLGQYKQTQALSCVSLAQFIFSLQAELLPNLSIEAISASGHLCLPLSRLRLALFKCIQVVGKSLLSKAMKLDYQRDLVA